MEEEVIESTLRRKSIRLNISMCDSSVLKMKTELVILDHESSHVDTYTINNVFTKCGRSVKQVITNDELRISDEKLVEVQYYPYRNGVKIKISNLTSNTLCVEGTVQYALYH